MTIGSLRREFELFRPDSSAGRIFIPTTRKHQLERKLARRVKELSHILRTIFSKSRRERRAGVGHHA